jgi:hypothetical protein
MDSRIVSNKEMEIYLLMMGWQKRRPKKAYQENITLSNSKWFDPNYDSSTEIEFTPEEHLGLTLQQTYRVQINHAA